MPVIQIGANIDLDLEDKRQLLISMAQLISSVMNKPLSDVMVLYSYNDLIMAETSEPAVFVDIRCISGLSVLVSRQICEGLYKLLNKITSIDSSRFYANFHEVGKEYAWRFKNDIAVCPVEIEESSQSPAK